MKSSHNNNIISSFISWIHPMKFLNTLFQISKRELRIRREITVIRQNTFINDLKDLEFPII